MMTDHVAGSVAEIGTDLTALRPDIAHLAETIRETVEYQTQAAGIRVSGAVGDARSKISDAAGDAQKNVKAASGEIGASIERNPLTAMLIALGVGRSSVRWCARTDKPHQGRRSSRLARAAGWCAVGAPFSRVFPSHSMTSRSWRI
jgi:ElaB/YqjD/DUF883 family membrane-anchored ribosome-binding protein